MKLKSVVALVKCHDYLQESLKQALSDAFNLLGGIRTILRPGIKVLLKPNIMMPKPLGHAANTHPFFIKAVIDVFREVGSEVILGESSAGSLAGMSFTAQALFQSGLAEIAKSSGVPLINFDMAPVVKRTTNNPLAPVIPIAKAVFDADLVVTLPKLKTHTYGTIITGAVKNCYGMVPGQIKAEFHRRAPKPSSFFTIIRDLFGIIRPGLAIMDAVTAMEGDGPSAGSEKHVGFILASRDPVAVDAVAAELIGVSAKKVLTNKLCNEAGLGAGDLDSIEVRGESLSKSVLKDFKLPAIRVTNPYVYQFVIKLTRTQPKIDHDICQLCNICQDSCPVQAITQINKKMIIDHKACIHCFCCCEVCPSHACLPKRKNILGNFFAKIISSRWL